MTDRAAVIGYGIGEDVTSDQGAAITQVIDAGAKAGFEPLHMEALKDDHIALLDEACPDESALELLARELENLARWYRAPAYFLADAFQHLTKRRRSRIHVTACLLFADAQMALADDMAFHSTEVAWRALRAIQSRGEDVPEGWLQDQQQVVLHRLRTQYRFYSRWARPFDYIDCNPLLSHLYHQRIVRDLREAYPDETDSLSSEMPPEERADLLSTTATIARAAGDVYHWLTARRIAAAELEGIGLIEQAEQALRSCLHDAGAAGLEAEIGHLLRSHGWNLMQLGRLEEAASAMEQAILHEQPPALFGYWAVLAAFELGDIRLRQGDPRWSEAHREGRKLLDIMLVGGGPPVGATVKRQMVSFYSDKSLREALLEHRTPDVLAEIEAAGPRSVGETLAEVRSAAEMSAVDGAEFLHARTVFHRHLTSVPATFEAYLADMDGQYESRRRYLRERQALQVLPKRTSDEIAERLLAKTSDDHMILAFAIGPRSPSCAVLLDLRNGSMDWTFVTGTEDDLRKAHHTYRATLADAEDLVGPSGAEARADAVREFCTSTQAVLSPALNMIADKARNRRLIVVPQRQLHAVPFSALESDGIPLLDIVSDIAVIPTLGLVADLLEADPRPSATLTVFHSSEVPMYEGCLHALSKARQTRVARNSNGATALEILRNAVGEDVLFACHGLFVPDNPSASYLTVAPGVNLTLADVAGSVMLPDCRTVVLGACESGVARAELGSEFIGLSGALLSAGIPSVVSALWKIDQIASTILIAEFCAQLGSTDDTPAALADAQRQLRRTTGPEVSQWLANHLPGSPRLAQAFVDRAFPFQRPVYWAGFVTAGIAPGSRSLNSGSR